MFCPLQWSPGSCGACGPGSEALAQERCWFPWRLSAFQQRGRNPGGMETGTMQSQSSLHALSPVVMSSLWPSCVSGKAKQGVSLLLPTAGLDLPEFTFPAAGTPWSGLCSVWLFLVNMSLTKKYSIYILNPGINFIPTPVSSRCHHKTSVRASLEYK